MLRYGRTGLPMDALAYHYLAGSNKLDYISDSYPSGFPNQSPGNYGYDGKGNVTRDVGNGITWMMHNLANLPVHVTKVSGAGYDYAYDATGARVKSTGSGKYYINGADGKTEAVVDINNPQNVRHNIWGNDMAGYVKQNGTTLSRFYYLKDHLGSIRMTVDASGTIAAYDDYDPYGMYLDQRIGQNGDPQNKYHFTGKERDIETNYDYFGARYYDPRIGRWLAVDPLAEKYPSLSPYSYCADNPLNYLDPDGRKLKSVVLKGMTKADPVVKDQTYYVDEKVADKVVNFVTKARAKFSGLSVNNTFRLENSSEIETKNTKAKGLSRHQAGFAVDLNGVSALTENQLKDLNDLAKENGLAPLAKQQDDLPHFDADPKNHGYKDLDAAVEENKKSYEELTKPPVKEEKKEGVQKEERKEESQ